MKFTYIKRDIIMNTIKPRSCRRTIFTAAIALAAVASGLTPITCKADEYWDRKVSLFSVLPIEENDIVFLGNSITDGGEFNELFNRGDVKNRGISSDVITGVEKRLEQVTSSHPRKIFLLIGINDVSHGLSVGQLSERYERLVKKIRTQSPETELYVQSVMPINNDFHRYRNLTGRERTVVELNKCIKRIAEENDAKYIDLWPFLADYNGHLKREFTNDGLHLNGLGYRAWTHGIRGYLEENPRD